MRQWPVPAGSTSTSPALTRASRPPGTAEQEARTARREAEDLVRRGVVVVEVVDPVAPLRRPALAPEESLEGGGGIGGAGDDGRPVEEDRQVGIVRHPAVAGQHERLGGGRAFARGGGVHSTEFHRTQDDGKRASRQGHPERPIS